MCKYCDDTIAVEDLLEPTEGTPHAQEVEAARAFFMAVLEESEPEALARYKAAEDEFTKLLDAIRMNDEAGITNPDLTVQGNEAFLAVAEAKNVLTHSLDKVAYKMTHHIAHA